MRVANTRPSASYFPEFGNLHDLEIEGAAIAGLSIETGHEWKFTNSDITNSSGSSGQGGADAYAVQCLPDSAYAITRGFMIVNSRIGNSASSGAFLNCRDTQFSSIQFFTTSASGAGVYPVISVGASAQDVVLTNIICEEFGGLAKASHCLTIASGAQRVMAGEIDPQYTHASPWYADANSPSVLNVQDSSTRGDVANRSPQAPTYVYATPSAGQTVLIQDMQDVAILNPPGPLGSLTVQLPTCSAAYDGKRTGFSTTRSIRALTVRAGAGAVQSVPIAASAGAAYRWECVGSQATWFLSP
jgi:hypothetical protein